MLPLQQAYEVKQSIIEYLRATFNFKDREVHSAFFDFIQHPTEGIFKGPYASLKLPFEKSDEIEEIPLKIAPNFPPYKHQLQAFQRLNTTNEKKPKPTIITTGTGSGKTEAFLYPILDYCYKHRNKQGVKVIILYPMNALASDQAKRLAEIIYEDERLKDSIRAGLFIGEGKNKKKYPTKMGEANIIESRDEIVQNPPDILLTNFKMLDYGLMRHQYHNLWSHNFDEPELLQFLVLDELHTYDGAQGTDVANLIRRLKLKLSVPDGHLCPVGTSATIGKGSEAVQLLTGYASEVFGELFEADSIISEHRLSPDQFFTVPENDLDAFIPRLVGIQQSRMRTDENYGDYIARQKVLWQLPEQIGPYQLGKELMKLKIVKDISSLCASRMMSIQHLNQHLSELIPAFSKLGSDEAFNPQEEVITSILALIAEAKADESGRTPFLFLQIQIWVREVSGLLRVFDEKPLFTWRDKLGGPDNPSALPPYFCRECGASGWLANKHDNRNQFERDPLEVYEKFFTNHKNIYLVNTHQESHAAIDEYDPSTSISPYIHTVDLGLHDHMDKGRMNVFAYRKVHEQKNLHVCPECNTANTISIVGTRVSTLNSISVSQILASDLDERPEKFRKVLAFTNGVQDAAHQAGFIEARNYRFTFRASLQRVINEIGEAVDLGTLTKRFIKYWKLNSDPSGADNLSAYFYRFFPSDYIGKAQVEDYRNPITKKFSKAFETEFDTRISWEIQAEFGYNATIGRTLEKTGSSGAAFNDQSLQEIYLLMYPWMQENLLQSIDEGSFLQFVNGVLHRMRIRGALDHEYLNKFRTADLKLWDLNWMRDGRHFLNRNFHPRTRIPKLVCNGPQTRGVLDTTNTQSSNWYHQYFIKSFRLAPSSQAIVNEFFETLFKQLSGSGILNRKETRNGEVNFAIAPSHLYVTKQVNKYACSHCSSRLSTTPLNNRIEGAACLNYRCKGVYQPEEQEEFNYYQLVYNRMRSPRIYAAEHTGVLDRGYREDIERDFKERPSFNSLNTLVATSTLEMGIDVGSLDVAINTAVPPLPSNFLQRVGRAGRSSGSALIENFAQNKAHDLFYYGDPLEMMDGDITTPGCFLNAKDILKRHFTAYCFDSWTKSDPEKNQIPGTIKSLNLFTTNVRDTGFFLSVFLDFIVQNKSDLVTRFEAGYNGQVDSVLFGNIKDSIDGGEFQLRLVRVFDMLKKELFFYRSKEGEIKALIKEKGLADEDQERVALEQERKTLRQMLKHVQSVQIIEHLTNVGILPNYAFPETGVTLNAHVYGFKPEGAEQEPKAKTFEIVRSASSALREFAPDNYFYSQGNRFEITGLNTFDWGGENSGMINMRFCSNCDNLKEDFGEVTGGCPKCGHESWASPSNIHKFARMSSVKSVNSRKKSALNDSKDDREQRNYKVSTHFKFAQNSIQGTWGMTQIPFGIEYVKEVELTKVNLGSGDKHSRHLSINQHEEVARHGFVTCKICGKSTSIPSLVGLPNSDKKFHYGFCKKKEEMYSSGPDEVFEEVFLFRRVNTEAIKILLPVQEFMHEADQQMFKAGLEVGLKKYYGGNPSHIAFEFYSEFNSVNDRFDRYLIAYDTIPGGTGYLQKLFDPIEFTRLLKLSFEAIKDCNCKAEGKDGCYRCILSYGNQFTREDLSRERAEGHFGKILAAAKDWSDIGQGLASLTESGMIEESELERKFVYSLKKFANLNPTLLEFQEFKLEGIVNYRLIMSNGNRTVKYVLRPQVTLGSADGVSIATRTDFYLKCEGLTVDGEVVTDMDELLAFKDVAVYLDGYTYHASESHMRFYDDMDIRNAIRETENIVPWSLSWADVEKFEYTEVEKRVDSFSVTGSRYGKTTSVLNKFPASHGLNKGLFETNNSIERLLWFLKNSNSLKMEAEVGLLFAAFQDTILTNIVSSQEAEGFVSDPELSTNVQGDPAADNYMLSGLTTANELYKSRILVRLMDFRVLARIHRSTLTEIEKSIWEDYLRLYCLVSII